MSEECRGEGYCFATYQETLPSEIFLSVSFVYIKPIVADWYLGALHKVKSPESSPAIHQVITGLGLWCAGAPDPCVPASSAGGGGLTPGLRARGRGRNREKRQGLGTEVPGTAPWSPARSGWGPGHLHPLEIVPHL